MAALPQGGARVLHRNLAELVGDSHTIVAGRILSVTAESHPQLTNLNTVVVTVKTSEVWKGQAGSQFTFRQFDYEDVPGSTLGYRVGDEVVLFLTQPSSYGLSSPAGLEQGRFRVTTDSQSGRQIVNGMNNMGLFRKMNQSAPQLASQVSAGARQQLIQHRAGPIPFDQLREMVLTLKATTQN